MKITDSLHVRSARWLIERNPTYLASAVCIAIGTRLFLVSPSTHAGDVGLILLTLGILQLYESLVGGLIILLHTRRRSPEDLPSLLLVMAAFWTGPMAATIEMTSHRADLGLVVAFASCLIAVIQLLSISRRLRLQLHRATMIGCTAFVIFLAASPPLLKTPLSADGANEVRMYVAWLALAALTLTRAWVRRPRNPISDAVEESGQHTRPSIIHGQWIDPAFFGITLVATVAHLVGMNHAFFTHAMAFYAAPLICSLAVVGARMLAIRGIQQRVIRITTAILPLCAIIISRSAFDADVPIERIPALLKNPFNTALCLAAISWWFIAWQYRSASIMHAANACLAVFAVRLAPTLPPETSAIIASPARAGQIPMSFITIIYGIAVYLVAVAVIRRSRVEGILAIAAGGIATICLVTNRIEFDMLASCWALGWSTWLMLLIARRNGPVAGLATPLVFLAMVDIWFGFDPAFSTLTMVHAAAMICVLFAAGFVWPLNRFHAVAAIITALEAAGIAARWLTTTDHASAAVAVFAGFALLAFGWLISWRKGTWLRALESPE